MPRLRTTRPLLPAATLPTTGLASQLRPLSHALESLSPASPAPAASLQAFSGVSSVYALLQAANLRSTIDVEALEPGMAGMQVLMEVRGAGAQQGCTCSGPMMWKGAAGPFSRLGCPCSCL